MPYYQIEHSVDPYTFSAPSDKIAQIVCILVEPWARLKDEDGTVLKPDLSDARDRFDVSDIKSADSTRCGKWFQERWDMPFSYAVEAYREILMPSLNSFVFGDISDRRRFDRAIAELQDDQREEFVELWTQGRTTWQDMTKKASSIADILGGNI